MAKTAKKTDSDLFAETAAATRKTPAKAASNRAPAKGKATPATAAPATAP